MSGGSPDVESRAPQDLRRWLPLMGFVVGLWGMLPKYVSPPLNTADRVEFADHVVPGLLVLAVSAAFLLWRGRGSSPLVAMCLGLAVLLAGFWMVATHLPLVAQALRDEAPWAGTIYHTSSGLAVFGVGLLWCTSYWSDLGAAEASSTGASGSASGPSPGSG